MSKPIKQWGRLSSVKSVSRSYSSPASSSLLWQRYTKEDAYTETTYSGSPEYVDGIAAGIHYSIDPETKIMTWYEVTMQTTNTPVMTISVKQGRAYEDYSDDEE